MKVVIKMRRYDWQMLEYCIRVGVSHYKLTSPEIAVELVKLYKPKQMLLHLEGKLKLEYMQAGILLKLLMNSVVSDDFKNNLDYVVGELHKQMVSIRTVSQKI